MVSKDLVFTLSKFPVTISILLLHRDATLPHSKHSRAMRQKRDSKLTGKKGAADSIDSTNLEFIYDVIELFGAHGRKSFLTTAWRRYRNFDRHFSWLLHLRIG